MSSTGKPPAQSAHVYEAEAIRVTVGANLDDPISGIGMCEPGDVYRLDPGAQLLKLALVRDSAAPAVQYIAQGSEIGATGDRIDLTSLLTLIAPDGERVEVLYAHHPRSGRGYAVPLSPIAPRTDYVLVDATDDIGAVRIADIICLSFAAGTMITLPSGEQRPINGLSIGDKVLTRDHGGQEIRWIGKATMRARGAFAPVVISAGTLGNHGDLVVSPHHRVFIYQYEGDRLGQTAELFVQAKHLVDDNKVTRRDGGFVDYYGLVFDRHEVIYAEGIPSESLMVNDATIHSLPPEVASDVSARFPGLSQHPHLGTDAGPDLLDNTARRRLFQRTGGE